jgi:hypothetical protein
MLHVSLCANTTAKWQYKFLWLILMTRCLLRSSGACSPSQIEESASNIGKTLEAIANGANEFSPRSDLPSSIGWNSFRIFYHLAKIGTSVPTAMLLRLAGKQSREDAKIVRATVSTLCAFCHLLQIDAQLPLSVV